MLSKDFLESVVAVEHLLKYDKKHTAYDVLVVTRVVPGRIRVYPNVWSLFVPVYEDCLEEETFELRYVRGSKLEEDKFTWNMTEVCINALDLLENELILRSQAGIPAKARSPR